MNSRNTHQSQSNILGKNAQVAQVLRNNPLKDSQNEKGVRQQEREGVKLSLDARGKIVEERHTYTVEMVSKARRIRCSWHFFPESVAALQARLFAEVEEESMEQVETVSACEPETVDDKSSDESVMAVGEQEGHAATKEQPVKRSAWIIVECEEFTDDIQEYRRRRRKALLEALLAIREGQKHLSRRVINVWAYQRALRKAG